MAKEKKSKKDKFKVKIVDKFNNEDFFDDCPICQVMKLAKEQGREPTVEELKEAFKRAKEQGGMVGGEWFKEDKK